MSVVINNLSDLIIYIAIGWLFIKGYRLTANNEDDSNIENILVASIVIGFMYFNLANMIPINISYNFDICCMIISSPIIGYTMSLFKKRLFQWKILYKLKIRENGNKYLWDDFSGKYYRNVTAKYGDMEYSGIFNNYESYSNTPHFTLVAYKIKKNDLIIEDHSKDLNMMIWLDSEKADYIEFEYDESDPKTQDFKRFFSKEELKEIENSKNN